MKKLIILTSIVVIPVIGFFVYYYLSRPVSSGTIYLPNIEGEATISLSKNGIPYINAATNEAALYALGYMHARDRLWQLHLKRMLVNGRLSEFAGEMAIEVDKFHRTLGFKRIAQENVKALDQETIKLFQSYANGINDYVDQLQFLPIEFFLVGTKFDKWEISDSVAFIKHMAFNINSEMLDRFYPLLRSRIKELVGEEFVDILVPFEEEHMFPNITTVLSDEELQQMGFLSQSAPKYSKKESTLPLDIEFRTENIDSNMKSLELAYNGHFGSNSWVVSGEHTVSGKPLLANDPHLDNSIPSLWYLASITVNKHTTTGGTFSGLPAILAGKNSYVGWGVTAFPGESVDFYQNKLNRENTHYLYKNKWIPLKSTIEKIKIKGKDTIDYTVRFTHHGPLFHDIKGEGAGFIIFGKQMFPKKPISLAWTGYLPNDATPVGLTKTIQFKSLKEFKENLQRIESISQAVVYVSEDNHIGYYATGRYPQRKSIFDSLYIREGWNHQDDWEDIIDGNNNIQLIDPEKGYIVSANNRPSSTKSKYFMGTTANPTARANRADELIKQKIALGQKMNAQDMINIQRDTVDVFARAILPVLLNLYAKNKNSYFNKTDQIQINKAEKAQDLIEILNKWDFNASVDSKPALVYFVWEMELIKTLCHEIFSDPDERNEYYNTIAFDQFFPKTILSWNTQITSNLNKKICSNEGNKNESNPCIKNIFDSLVSAYDYIEENVGKNKLNWKWGTLHQMIYPHLPLSENKFLKLFFFKSLPSGGSGRTLNVAHYKTDSYEGISSANFRSIIDFGRNKTSRFCVDTGQSGDMMSSHYDDMFKLCRVVKLLSMTQEENSRIILKQKK